ncbi:MAG: DUF4982 domain-containing protein [Butyrivibrio sp.]|nr:DUF4982 domain-containing protein [Butyrivibrio sp.]
MRSIELFNDGWEFIKIKPGQGSMPSGEWERVDLPHDWLIYNSNDLYEESEGWYRKSFTLEPEEDERYALRFDGVYMEPTVYINGIKAGEWKYGYNTFEIDITDLLKHGENEVSVRVLHRSPNSRWYSGAGIYRNVWLKKMPRTHIVSDGIYIRTERTSKGFNVKASAEVSGADGDVVVAYHVLDANGKTVESQEYVPGGTKVIAVRSPILWSLDNPYLYTLRTEIIKVNTVTDSVDTRFGFRTIKFDANKGFFLNGEHIKIRGVCMHHDLGALGAAFNKTALKRQLEIMKSMGANAIRTSHNMPAPELMDLADEMGFLVDDEAFDMWKFKKTEYDYSRFFDDWAKKDIRNFVRRDRNHPSLIMWSIGNEIYDTHADAEGGYETTKLLVGAVREHDPDGNAFVTFASNYMEGEPTQRCAELLDVVGYNYAERLYEAHHAKRPRMAIYGSETSSTVQSRGVYHFPYSEQILMDIDEQCSSLGNSTCSWGAKNTEFCIITERDTEYSAGQFLWTGFDYIGEPTPYSTKNSYFGQVDTAGFKKDSFYIYQAEWTDYKKNPMVHIFPYWDFNEGQPVDVRVTSNAPQVELFFNGESQGKFDIDHAHGKELVGHWVLPYSRGRLDAVAYDEKGNIIARDTEESFGDAASLVLKPDQKTAFANGRDLVFVEINVLDAEGRRVKNANNRVNVEVEGAGRLVGLDNGDSTDYDSYKGTSRRLFMGRLLAIVATNCQKGDIIIKVSSEGMQSASVKLQAVEAEIPKGISAETYNLPSEPQKEIPIRKIELTSSGGTKLTKGCEQTRLTAKLYPADCTYKELEWLITADSGVESHLADISDGETDGEAVLTARGDGHFNVKCFTRNGGQKIGVVSQLGFDVSGLGAAFVNPYAGVAAPLYSFADGEIGNAVNHGISTSKNAKAYVGYDNVDFGSFGSDEIELDIFTFDQKDYRIEVWSGVPDAEGSELLAEGIYNKPVMWEVYQKERFKLKHRIRGVHTICIRTEDFINIKSFCFVSPDKGLALIHAAEYDKIYGDEYELCGDCVKGIGNNVSIDFDGMDFKEGVGRLTIKGTSYIEVNTLNIIFTDAEGRQTRQMLGFEHTDKAEEKTFDIERVSGLNRVTFVFLPGSRFDFEWFRFE